MKTKLLVKAENFLRRTGNFIFENRNAISLVFVVAFSALCMLDPAFAASDYKKDVKDVFSKIVDIIGYVFQVVGAILAVYSVGQLVMAFKNEDADSKTRASTQLVIAIVLLALPSIIDTLGLDKKIGK